MKFDFAIGNPPYQEESETNSTTNGQKARKNIFHYFQIEADKVVTGSTVLIYPAGRWIHQSGKGLQKFGKSLINDVKLSNLVFYPNSKEIFGANIDIPDGVSIVVKKMNKSDSGFEYVYSEKGNSVPVFFDNPGDDLIPLDPNDVSIVQKIKKFVEDNGLSYLHDAILPRSLFSIESDFVANNSAITREYVKGEKIDAKKEIRVLTNDKPGPSGRTKWFVMPKELVTVGTKYVTEWQVVVSSAHPGGQHGRDNQLEIIDDKSIFGRARVALKSFRTKNEAENFAKFLRTDFIRFALLLTDESLSSLAKKVPDIVNYTNCNELLDFTGDINLQLFDLCGISCDERKYIENIVKNNKK